MASHTDVTAARVYLQGAYGIHSIAMLSSTEAMGTVALAPVSKDNLLPTYFIEHIHRLNTDTGEFRIASSQMTISFGWSLCPLVLVSVQCWHP